MIELSLLCFFVSLLLCASTNSNTRAGLPVWAIVLIQGAMAVFAPAVYISLAACSVVLWGAILLGR